MDAAGNYDWLFPKGRFSRQAQILETQLLYSGSLSGKSQSAKILQRALSSSRRAKAIPEEFPSPSSVVVAKKELVRLSAAEVLPWRKQDGLFLVPDDRLLMGQLQHSLKKKEMEASKASRDLQREALEVVRLRGENRELGRQLEQTVGQIGQLETRLGLQEKQLTSREKSLLELNDFLQDTAEKQARAREALRGHMEELMQRAESAENEIESLKSSLRPVSCTPSHLHPASASGTLHGPDNSRLSWRGRDQGQSHSNGSLYAPMSSAWMGADDQGHPGRSWTSLRWPSPAQSEISPSNRPSSALHPVKQYPGLSVNPTSSKTESNGHHPGALFLADSGLDSLSTGNRLSADRSEAPSIARLQPHHPRSVEERLSSSRIPQEQTSRYPPSHKQSSASLSQSLTNSQGIRESREDLVDEPVIRPSVNSSLQQDSPAQLSSRSWDFNFLNEIMEDILRKREAQSRAAGNKPSGAEPRQESQLGVPSQHANQLQSLVQAYGSTPSPYRQDDSPAAVIHHWSSSDYDEDEESESDVVPTHRSRLTERSISRASFAQHPHWRAAWLSVFSHLDTATLLTCAQVCKEWQAISKHPSLWRTVRLTNRKISSKFLQALSQWCEGLEHLFMEGLKPRSRVPGESRERYAKNTRGSLEPGFEHVLLTAGTRLITLKIVDCSNILTERSLFLASCYCRNLYSLTYISQTDPIGHEVIWALGAGCRNIASLKVPPRQPCQQHQRLSNRCLQMIGRCWPMLLALSVGGPSIDVHGLASVARNCPRLQVLELDHLPEVTEVIAVAMCQAGLRGLHTLILRNTLISPAAVMQFNGACSQLQSLSVYLSPGVCRGDNRDFHNIVSRLRALTKKRILSDVLHVYAKYN